MRYHLTKMEEDIMELLWKNGKWMSGANFWEYFNHHGKPCERSTVNTYLSRMTEKGYLVKNGTKYIYAYTKEEFETKKAQEVLNVMYEGSLAKFVNAATGKKKISEKDAAELRKYLDSLDFFHKKSD